MISKYASHLTATSTRYKAANKQVMLFKHRLGIPAADEDHFLIDEWDDLAEKSGLIVTEKGPEGTSPGPKAPHLKPVDLEARRA